MREYTTDDYSKAYSWAELSSDNLYPDYLKKEAEGAISKISAYQNEDTVNIAFMTDIHYSMTETNHIRMQRILNVYKDISNNIKVCKLVLGGDHVCDACKEYKMYAFKELKEQFGDIEFFPINGNHDDGTIWDMRFKNEISAHQILPEERHSLFYFESNKKTKTVYYYSDDSENKIRHIFLDSNDIDYIFDNGKLRYRGQDMFVLSQNQLDWFVNDALNLPDENWNSIIYIHGLLFETDSRLEESDQWTNQKLIHHILKAYKNKENLSLNFGEGDFQRNVSVDFSKYKNAEIIACIAGDAHKDKENITSYGMPIIVERNAFPFFFDPPEVERRDGDKTEIAFAIITVDKKSRTIYVTRIGKGEDSKLNY